MQYFIEVYVADASYHGQEALTYSCEQPLAPGTLVTVPLRSKSVFGVISARVKRPAFAAKAIASVIPLPPLSPQTLELIRWIQAYYPSPLGVIVQQFLPKKLPKTMPEPPALQELDMKLPTLTTDQTAALATIDSPGTYLLHGQTGTGKTRVYIELAAQALAAGRSTIILTPEISLTSQLAQDFRQVFGARVVVIHSRLTETVRNNIWAQLSLQTKPCIVIGPRSALFSPLTSIGFIAVDEAHETSYKQDQAPYYHTTRIASKLAGLHQATLVLGSATPLVTDYYLAKAKGRPIIDMKQTAASIGNAFGEQQISVVDLRDKTQFTKKQYISDILIGAIHDSLQKQEQILLFLNRRGTARVVFCEHCGWQATCPRCDVPLVYHGDTHIMRCHSCDFKAASPISCPDCHNAAIVYKSIGTKAIADDIARLFPDARIQRFDTDNKKDERIEEHFEAVRTGAIDILIGTQTIAKGLDLPKLGLVGILIADTSLSFPDFSAQERTYQLLSQVIGRVGRGHRAGRAIIQTYAPDSPLLQSILSKNWETFYQTELAERKQFLFPPFCYLLQLTCRRATLASAEKTAVALATTLKQSGRPIIVEGPAPSFHEKVQDKYQWQIIVKAKNRNELTSIITHLPSGWSYDIDPMNLL